MKKEFAGAYARYIFLQLLLIVLLLLFASKWCLYIVIILALLPIVSWGLNFYVSKHLEISINVPSTAAKNVAVEVEVDYWNSGFIPVMKMFHIISIRNELTGEESYAEIKTKVGARRYSHRSILIESSYCGQIRLSEKRTIIPDFLGLIPLSVNTGAVCRTTILPNVYSAEVSINSLCNTEDNNSADKKGDDRSELYQLREYQSGDDIRQIHWKLSSKIGDLIIREPGAPQSKSLLVFWDKRFDTEPKQIDSLAEVTVSVCQSIINLGVPFTLSWTDGEELQVEEIMNDDSLLQSIPALIKGRGSKICALPDYSPYGKVIYVSSEPLDEAESNVCMLICSENATGKNNAIVFSPYAYEEVIQRLEM